MTLRSALALSLLVHLLLASLWVAHQGMDGNRGTTKGLQAALLRHASDVATIAQSGRSTAGVETNRQAGTPLRNVLTSAEPSSVTAPRAAEAGLSVTEGPAAASAAESRKPVDSLATDAPRDAVSAEGLRQYRILLAREAKRYRQYPAVARARGWEGTVEVRVDVTVGGRPAVGLARSSGYEVLDEQAVEMMGRAVLAAMLPDSLRGQSFSVPVPVAFTLND